MARAPSLEDLRREEEQAAREEYEEIERRRKAAAQLALQKGLGKDESEALNTTDEGGNRAPNQGPQHIPAEDVTPKVHGVTVDEGDELEQLELKTPRTAIREPSPLPTKEANGKLRTENTFVPARLPHFG